jgi:hypothetical protein
MKDMRELMCITLEQNSKLHDPTSEVVISTASVISRLLIDSSQLTSVAVANCTTALSKTLSGDVDPASVENSVAAIAAALSNALSGSIELSNNTKVLILTILRNIGTIIQSNQLPREPPLYLLANNVRSTIAVVDSTVNSLALPQTDFESANRMLNTVILAVSGLDSIGYSRSVAVSLLIGVSPVQVDGQLVSIDETFQNDNSVIISGNRKLRARNTFATTTYHVQIVNKYAVKYSRLGSSKNVTVTCVKQLDFKSYNQTVQCPITQQTVTCPGNEWRKYNIMCPRNHSSPVCQSPSGDFSGFRPNLDCAVSSYDESTTTCLCKVQTNISDTGHYEYSTAEKLILDNFVATFESVEHLSLNALIDNPSILTTACVFIGILFVGFAYFIFKDIAEAKFINVRKKYLAVSQYADVKKFFNSALTPEYSGQAWYVCFYHHLLSKHDLLCFIYPFNGTTRDYRTVRFISIMGRILNFMWIDILLSKSFTVDPNSCPDILTEADCVRSVSLNQIDTLCVWDVTDDILPFQ